MSDYQRVRGSKKYDIFPLDSLHVGIISGKPRIIDNYLISKSEWWLQHGSACLTPKRQIFQMGIVPKKGARWTNLQPILEHTRNMLKPNKQCYRLVLYQAPTHAASIHFSEEPAVLPLSADWSWSISLNSRSWFPAGYQCRNGWVIILPWYAPKFAILRGKQLLDLDSYHVHSFSTNGKSQPLEKGPYHTLLGGALTDAEGRVSCVKYCGTKRAVANMWEGKGLATETLVPSSQNGKKIQVKSNEIKGRQIWLEVSRFSLEFSLLFSCVQKWLGISSLDQQWIVDGLEPASQPGPCPFPILLAGDPRMPMMRASKPQWQLALDPWINADSQDQDNHPLKLYCCDCKELWKLLASRSRTVETSWNIYFAPTNKRLCHNPSTRLTRSLTA